MSSSFATTGLLQVFIDGQLANEQTLTIEPGQRTLSLSLPAGAAGFRRVEVRVNAVGDTQALNNRADALVEVQGSPHILLIAAESGRASNLQAALQAVNIRTTLLTPAQAPASLEPVSYTHLIRLGAGPILAHKDAIAHYDHALTAQLERTATAINIPIQHAIFGSFGSDGAALMKADIPSAMVAFPARYTHTPFETAHRYDLETLVDWLCAFVRGL